MPVQEVGTEDACLHDALESQNRIAQICVLRHYHCVNAANYDDDWQNKLREDRKIVDNLWHDFSVALP